MIRFCFQLRPPEELTEKALEYWYFLTDGWYWIEAGEQELFRWTDTTLAAWQTEAEGEICESAPPPARPYADYYVARFWQDLLQCVRQALLPVPDDIAALLWDRGSWEMFLQRSAAWAEEPEDDLSRWERRNEALQWWWWRQLDSGHFTAAPKITLWRQGEQVILDWHHSHNPEFFTASPSGRVVADVSSFRQALLAFDEAFLTQMAVRIVGRSALEKSHAAEAGLLMNALTHPWEEDWAAIRLALEDVRNALGAVQ
ncbi:DUF5984 family protein [Armatimonas sp.]|uniref:DUF5984 family protein n=1 Tax=Armatimonas sp. TaxID=1872638 RepID=UPI003751F9D2